MSKSFIPSQSIIVRELHSEISRLEYELSDAKVRIDFLEKSMEEERRQNKELMNAIKEIVFK